ncbi:hypothetical protein D918_03731 [Trichuris suis]|nr:hypothetical protein D918_03731 [Trichuris suis]
MKLRRQFVQLASNRASETSVSNINNVILVFLFALFSSQI